MSVCPRVRRLSAEYCQLLVERDKLVERLLYNSGSQRYLQSVVEISDEFHEIHEITARYATLVSTRQVG